MGADGGVYITKMEVVRKDWAKIKNRLVEAFQPYEMETLSHWQTDESEENAELLKATLELPDSVAHMSYTEIVASLQYLKNCDCPRIYDDLLITGYGDAIPNSMNELSRALVQGTRIETWT